jgi:hypothetical protein
MTVESMRPTPASQSVAAPNGSAWAALLSAGIGCTAFGIFTMLSECIPAMTKALNWYNPSGALSGVAICSIVIWLIVWAVLGVRWHHRRLQNERTLMIATALLVLVGIATTFPPFYALFGG